MTFPMVSSDILCSTEAFGVGGYFGPACMVFEERNSTILITSKDTGIDAPLKPSIEIDTTSHILQSTTK
jgi:hypothetical protein